MSRSATILEIKWNYDHNDFEHAAPVETMENFFRNDEVNRKHLADFLRTMARRCENGDYPFRMIGTQITETMKDVR